MPIGMNLAGIADWEVGFPFRNLMWGARTWGTRNAEGDSPWNTEKLSRIGLDEDGYPLEIPWVVDGVAQEVFTLVPNVLKPGRYVLLYDGEGEVDGFVTTRRVDVKPGRVELEMWHDRTVGYEGIRIRRSVRGNHVRNMRLLALEDEGADLTASPFRTEFLDFCKPFHCLRFMDWLATNNSINREWGRRKRRSFYTQTGSSGDIDGFFGSGLPAGSDRFASGVAVELCIEAANQTGCDAWLCVPHRADDDYIREMAKLTKEKLDPRLKVYVEFSNEIWNWMFMQAQWMLRSQVAAEGVAAVRGRAPWKDGRVPEAFVNQVAPRGEGVDHPERTGALFRRCFRIWEDVFTGADRQRLVRVCTVQGGWPDTARRTLRWCVENGGCDAVSPAGYVGPDDEIYQRWEAAGANLTAEQVVADMMARLEGELRNYQEIAVAARQAGVAYVVYEGGQHIQPKNQAELPYNPALGAAQRHPKMYDLYLELLRRHQDELGCTLFAAFSSVGRQGERWGSWGHLEHYGQDPAEMPKMRALLDFNPPRPHR